MQKPMIAAGIFALAAVLFLAATFTTNWLSMSNKHGSSVSFGFLSAQACHKGECQTTKIKKDELKMMGYAMTTVGCLAAFAAGLAGLVLFMHRTRVKNNGAITGTMVAVAIVSMLFVLAGVAMLFVFKEALRRGPAPDLGFSWSFYLAVFATMLTYGATFMPLAEETLSAPAQAPLPPPAPEA